MSRSAPALAPLFRSDQQLRILAELFATGVDEFPIGELAHRAGVAQATVSREVARLAEHGLVRTRTIGRNKLVRANWDLSWATDLRSILVQTVGVLGRLAHALTDVSGVDSAFVFGSWAARYRGEPGPPPHDIDVLAVGSASLTALRRACRPLEGELRLEINPVIVTVEEWSAPAPTPFLAQLRSQPIVEIPLEHDE